MPGYEIFRYKNTNGTYQDLDSDEVNDYIATYMGDEFSSKDFRTWAGSRLGIECYEEALKSNLKTKNSRKKFSNIY